MKKDRYLLVLKTVISAIENATKEEYSIRKIVEHAVQFGERYDVKPIEIWKVLDASPIGIINDRSEIEL